MFSVVEGGGHARRVWQGQATVIIFLAAFEALSIDLTNIVLEGKPRFLYSSSCEFCPMCSMSHPTHH